LEETKIATSITRTPLRLELDHMYWELRWPAKDAVPAASVFNAMALSQITQYLKGRRLKYASAP
jgi:hypothetical protein